jgi:carbon monoxide dehydrogenase subunit G
VAIRIEERFVVRAPAGRVWDFLVDPRRVVACVPGGELHRVVDARTYDGAIRVAVGPLALAYRGRVRLAEADAAARRVTILGDARERGGADAARLALESGLRALPGDATEVVVHARVQVEGGIVSLGRGALERLGHVVFQDFAACVRARVEAEHEGRPPPPPRGPLRPVPLLLRALGAWLAALAPRRRRRP